MSRAPYFVWSVHLDGDKQDHDKSVCQAGIYDRAVAAIKDAKARGFRVNINCTLFNNAEPERVANFFDDVMAMGVDGITVSPGYAYERAPDQQHFLNREHDQATVPRHLQARQRRQAIGRSASPALFLDFLAGNQTLPLHAVGQPDAHGVRLAEALLPARRRLRQDLQGTDGRHRLGRLRHRQLREVRRLHGAFAASRRPRSTTRSRNPLKALGVSLRGVRTEGDDGAGDSARPAAAGRIRVFAACRAQARGNPRRPRITRKSRELVARQ